MHRMLLRLTLFTVLVTWLWPPLARALPYGFVVDNMAPGAGFDVPVAVAFLPDYRMLVVEKRGRVYIVDSGVKDPTPILSIENEVLNESDRGMLSVAVDPDFAANRYVYFLYTVDPDSNGVDDTSDGFGRLTRYTLTTGTPPVVDPASRTILLGVDWPNGPLIASPSHTIGHLQWGADGSLLVSTGDGAHFDFTDAGGNDPEAFGAGKTDPNEDIGAFRSQDPTSLSGNILRLDPATGHGHPSNPYYDGDATSERSKVFAYGLRNPFRFTVRPGTGNADPTAGDPGVIYSGDVGWVTWEEMNVIKTPGANLGWPCYEGIGPEASYQAATPAHNGCGTIGVPPGNPAPHTTPLLWWHHFDSGQGFPGGFIGNASAGCAFYTGAFYPASYQGKMFMADFGQSWLKVLEVDGSDAFVSLTDFASGLGGPVMVTTHPQNGDIIYVSIYAQEVYRVRYTGVVPGNDPPIADAAAAPSAGLAPLMVTFDGSGSMDPNGDPLTYAWTFGDGNGSTQMSPMHTYTLPGTYQAILTVTDDVGAQGVDSTIVVVAESFNFPTAGILDDFNRPDGPVGAPWIGNTSPFQIQSNEVAIVGGTAWGIWDGSVFGANQEAYVTFNQFTIDGNEHILMLKCQGVDPFYGHIEIHYNDVLKQLVVNTYTLGVSWELAGGPFSVSFGAGDQLGARALADGTVELYKNGTLIAAASVAYWPHSSGGGRIGMNFNGAPATLLDDFGGGDVVLSSNTPPSVVIQAPQDSSFFAAGDTIWLEGSVSDAEDPVSALTYRFEADLHHNTHVHPNAHVVDDTTGSFEAENHDDGTGVWFKIRLRATDTQGASDTATVLCFPEVDLVPGPFSGVWQWGTEDTAAVSFRLHNRGRMPAPISRWRLVADDAVTLAEGDTIVPALDNVLVVRSLPPTLTVGLHVLRLVADTLGAVVETSEVNNDYTATIEVVEGNATVGLDRDLPLTLALGSAYPNPTAGAVRLDLALPASARIALSIHDLQGREVWGVPWRPFAPGVVPLQWNGRTRAGLPARPGVYLARVRVQEADGHTARMSFVRRFVLLR